MSRVAWPAEVRRKANEFYGRELIDNKAVPRCVITDRGGADLHHLDGDHTRSTFANCVPIEPSYNQFIDRPSVPSLGDWEPDGLYRLADSLFFRSEYARAYGISRLVSFLALRDFGSPSDICRFAALALEACRVLAYPALGVDVIQRNLNSLIWRHDRWHRPRHLHISMACRAIGSWFSTLEDNFAAVQWYRRAVQLLTLERLVAPDTALPQAVYTKRKLAHAWRMATGRPAPRLEESLREDYQLLRRADLIDSNAGDLVIAARSALLHDRQDDIDQVRIQLDDLVSREFAEPFDPHWLLDPSRRPKDLNPWNWTGVVDVQAAFQSKYDHDEDTAMGAVEGLVKLHHGRGGRVFRTNASRAWQTLAAQNDQTMTMIVPYREQLHALHLSHHFARSFAVRVDEDIAMIHSLLERRPLRFI